MTPTLHPGRRRRLAAFVLVALLAVSLLGVVGWALRGAGETGGRPSSAATGGGLATNGSSPVPKPGHEVYGFVPYWELDAGISSHVADTPLSTLALFSVTQRRSGTLATSQAGYRRITGAIGRELIDEAHRRGVHTELVFTTFGSTKNARFFSNPNAQARTIADLVVLAHALEVDGINVDAEHVDLEQVAAYGSFVGQLRDALRKQAPAAQVSVATTANETGAVMALAAAQAGADRVFVMGYDYHSPGSQPGASAPLARRDGSPKTLGWSLDLYREIGVPVERTILGLPLFGTSWPTAGNEIGAASTGRGAAWIPRRHLDVLDDPNLVPTYDPIEGSEFLTFPEGQGWRSIYYDSPDSLAPKLALADERGLAGAGFWAIGYERGVPGITELIGRFRAGQVTPSG